MEAGHQSSHSWWIRGAMGRRLQEMVASVWGNRRLVVRTVAKPMHSHP